MVPGRVVKFTFSFIVAANKINTRMHSSRMRTVCCSGRLLGGGGCLPGGCNPPLDKIPDKRFRKHHLSVTTVADGKNYIKTLTF